MYSFNTITIPKTLNKSKKVIISYHILEKIVKNTLIYYFVMHSTVTFLSSGRLSSINQLKDNNYENIKQQSIKRNFNWN